MTDPTTAPGILRDAAACLAQRATDYDQPGGERSMPAAVAAWSAITGKQITAAEGWLLLATLKMVRAWSASGYHADSFVDGVNYTALAGEARAAEEADHG